MFIVSYKEEKTIILVKDGTRKRRLKAEEIVIVKYFK